MHWLYWVLLAVAALVVLNVALVVYVMLITPADDA